MIKGGREGYEVSQAAEYDQFRIFDVCKHGFYPNESDCGCKYPDAPDKVLLVMKHRQEEYNDAD